MHKTLKHLAVLSAISITLLSLAVPLKTSAQKSSSDKSSDNGNGGYFQFNSQKKLIFGNADASTMAKRLVLVDDEQNEYYAVTNVLDNSTVAISPIKVTDKKLRVKGVDNYSVRDYDGVMYVQNEDNLDNIAKSILDRFRPVLYRSVSDNGMGIEEKSKEEVPAYANAESKSVKNDSLIKSSDDEDFSKTNIQTEGVDEADIIKTDGKNIYYAKDNQVVILSANAKDMRQLSGITVKNTYSVQEMYLDGDTLSIFYDTDAGNSGDVADKLYSSENGKPHCAMDLYDISDPEKPKLKFTKTYSGNYIESRKQGNTIYCVTQDGFEVEYPKNNRPMPIAGTGDEKKLEISPDPQQNQYPKILKGKNDLSRMIYLPFTGSLSVSNVSCLKLGDSNHETKLTVMGGSENIYMSQKNIYFTTGDSGDFDNWDYKPMTTIAKFKLGGGFDFSGSAMISGTPVDQFAFNERNGKFFAAYTVYDYSKTGTQANTENRLAAFDENMKPINEIKNLAIGEKIYSARYMGDKAYLVTFKQVDPLFVIDVKDPKNMKTLGYLKVPGYSDYLHPYKDKYLIGFGYDTEENDHGGTVNSGYKVSVFDISDFANPKQVDSKVIGKRGTYSPLSQNHKALMFDYSRDIFAFPIYVTDSITKGKGKEAYEQTYPVFSGVYAFKVSENGLDLKGKITHLTAKEQRDMQNHIYEYEREIQRAVQVKDTIYTVSNDSIKATDINTFKELAYLKFK